MAKNNNTIWWILGIILFLIVATKVSFKFPFAIVTETICADGVTNYYPLDGNLLDLKGNLNAINNGAVFVNGKINQGIEFNGTNYISFPTLPTNLSVGFWINNYTFGGGWIYLTYDNSSILSSTFGLGLNGSVDEIVVGTNVSGLSGIQACYIKTTYENVTCKEYATSQVPTLSSGCLNYSGDFFPNCSYSIENQTTYKIENNLCVKNYYCQDCIYPNCYSTLEECQTHIVNVTTTPSTVSTTSSVIPPETSEKFSLNKEVFNLFGYSITVLHLIIALLLIIGILYFMGAFGKK